MKIGIFDSGMGGLSLLHKAIKYLPGEDYIFYADVANVPYGSKTPEQIRAFSSAAAEFMIAKGCKAMVVACNTATSVAIEHLRSNYDFPILGIEPAVKPAVTHEGHKRVLVMATPVTVREAKLHMLISRLEAQDDVDLLAMPDLVSFAEREEFGAAVEEYIKKQLGDTDLTQYSDLVLGCTHYNNFKDTFSKIFPKETAIIDGSRATIRHLDSILTEKGMRGGGNGNVEYYTSGGVLADNAFCEKAQRFLSRLEEMEKITCGTL
ncbi:MAG: glutamate racemase [Oscillospiraceae bacterium]|nr:glutamate racemase [Oscillospiraceae bacterium]